MHQARFTGNGGLQRGVVHVKPALGGRVGRTIRLGIDRNDFQIGQWIGRRGNFEQAVVSAKKRMFPARAERDTHGVLAPLHAKLQRTGHDD